MTPARHARKMRLLERVAKLSRSARRRRLEEECRGDRKLFGEVLDLLEEYDRGESGLGTGLRELGLNILAQAPSKAQVEDLPDLTAADIAALMDPGRGAGGLRRTGGRKGGTALPTWRIGCRDVPEKAHQSGNV